MNNSDSSFESTPAEDTTATQPGSLQRGISGDYQLILADVLKQAWARVSGNKRTIWMAVVMYGAVWFGIILVFTLLLGPPPAPVEGVPAPASPGQMLQQLVTGLLLTPLWVGLVFVGVAIASDRPARPTSIFSWYGLTLKLFFTYLLMGFLILLGTLLLVLPGIYLAVSYQLALPLVADKNLSPWQALEASRKAITHKWFTFFGFWLVLVLAMLASGILLGIPYIWTLPAALIGLGIVYRDVFGAESETLRKVAGQ